LREKQITTLFGKKNAKIGVFELKICKGTSIPFSRIEEHQILSLLEAEEKGFYHKIADQTLGANGYGSTMKKPFDSMLIPPIPAYLVICWYVPRKRKTYYYIRVSNFVKMACETTRKSATEDMCKNFAEEVIEMA
jgi:penicillin-binding protein-related factor A (putative recombinase)